MGIFFEEFRVSRRLVLFSFNLTPLVRFSREIARCIFFFKFVTVDAGVILGD
jgi:hypothetical protein